MTPPFHKRLYVWSVIMEPLFFFVLFEEAQSGVTGNLSRILQVVTLAVLAVRLLWRITGAPPRTVPIPNPFIPLYRRFSVMFILAIAAGIVGYFRGAYELPVAYTSMVGERSWFSGTLNSASVRPIFEYLAMAYYFGYFVVLPQYLLTSAEDVSYALSRFKRMFVISFAIGVVDLAFSMTGTYLVPRHLSDWLYVEARFHGLAGEPRQAFVYLFLGLALFHLMAFREGKRLNRRWTIAIILAAALTQSTTGLVAVAIFIGLYGIYEMRRLSIRNLMRLLVISVLLVGIGYVTVISSRRTMAYFVSASDLWYILETNQPLPYLMSKSNSDIYPLYDLTVKARAGDFLPVVFGSGMGSASATTNRYYREWAELNNPHSQLARSLFETGLFGTWLYIMVFVGPVRDATAKMAAPVKRQFMMLVLLLVACTLADRSSVPFVYLGLFAGALRVWGAEKAPYPSESVSPGATSSPS